MPTKNTTLRRRKRSKNSYKVRKNKSMKRSRRSGPKRTTKRSRRNGPKRYSRKKKRGGGGGHHRERSPSPPPPPPEDRVAIKAAKMAGHIGRSAIDNIFKPLEKRAWAAMSTAGSLVGPITDKVDEINNPKYPHLNDVMDEEITKELNLDLSSPERIHELMRNGGLWKTYRPYLQVLKNVAKNETLKLKLEDIFDNDIVPPDIPDKPIGESEERASAIDEIFYIYETYKALFEARNDWLEDTENEEKRQHLLNAANDMKVLDDRIKLIYLGDGTLPSND